MNRTTTPHRDNESPLVSVIIPAYNADQFIAQAIHSVLNQTYRSYEIIVVDDGSTDKTKAVLQGFNDQISCLYQENRGPSAARNAGIKIAQGTYICFLDADDLWTPEKLEVQLAFMVANPDIALVFSDHEEFNEEGIVLSSYLGEKHKTFGSFPLVAGPLDNPFGKLVLENFISTPTVMVRKPCLEKAGLFDEEIWSVEDRDLWLRISASCKIACIPKIFCKRRFHEANISRQPELALRGKIRVLEKNWKLWPRLVPDLIWRGQLTDYYFRLGCVLLQKGERWKACQAGVKSVSYEVAMIMKDKSVAFRQISRSIGLVGTTLLGWQLSRSLWRQFKKVFHLTR